MSEFTIAKRESITPLIGIFGKSSGGKTLSALKMARGLVGPSGKIAVTDSENGRAKHFADDPSVAPYFTLDIQPPFSPTAYRKCQETAVASGAAIHIVDSASHCWNGEGGCLQMVEKFLDEKAGNDWAKRDKLKMMAWSRVTPEHDLWVNALIRSPIPVILCFRAKDKIVMEREDGKTKISTDENAPVSRRDLIYESTVAFECFQQEKDGQLSGGYFHIRKPGPPSLQKLLMEFKDERLSPKIGQLIAQWCKAPIMPGTPFKSANSDDLKALKKELWKISASISNHQNDPKLLEQWLWDEGLLSDTENLQEVTADRLGSIIRSVNSRIQK